MLRVHDEQSVEYAAAKTWEAIEKKRRKFISPADEKGKTRQLDIYISVTVLSNEQNFTEPNVYTDQSWLQ